MFEDLRYELTRGFAYRRIEHDHQSIYVTVLPVIFGLICTGVYMLIPDKMPLLGKDGILSSILSVVATLPGFYFAGLAAVATFGSPSMDTDMPSPAPQIEIRIRGTKIKSPLSRRKYMSYLFSYLVLLSFILCGLIILLNVIQPTIQGVGAFLSVWKWGFILKESGEAAAVLMISTISASVAVTTLQGLFFLSERIHQP